MSNPTIPPVFPIKDPYLLLYAFFNDKEVAEKWGTALVDGINLSQPADATISLRQGSARNEASPPGMPLCELYQPNDSGDIWIVNASLDVPQPDKVQSLAIWPAFAEKIFGQPASDAQDSFKRWQPISQALPSKDWRKRDDTFLGISLLFVAESQAQILLPARQQALFWWQDAYQKLWRWWQEVQTVELRQAEEAITRINTLLSLPGGATGSSYRPSAQKWGVLWQRIEQFEPVDARLSPHLYVVLTNPQQSEVCRELLLRNNHFNLIELSLHKAYQQIGQNEAVHEQLKVLNQQLNKTLETFHTLPEPTAALLQQLATQYYQLEYTASRIADVHTTVSINLGNYEQTAKFQNLFHAHDNVFSQHLKRMQEGQHQLKVDQQYYQSAAHRAKTGLESGQATLDAALLKVERHKNELSQRRDIIIAVIGVIIGIAQIWPLADKALELWKPKSLPVLTFRMWSNGTIFITLTCATCLLLLYAFHPAAFKKWARRIIFALILLALLLLALSFTELWPFLQQQWNNLQLA